MEFLISAIRFLVMFGTVLIDCKMYMSCNTSKCTIHNCAGCPNGYNLEETEFGQMCFKFYDEDLTWDQAKAKCDTDNAEMVIPKGSQEEKQDFYNSLSNSKEFWVGIEKRDPFGINDVYNIYTDEIVDNAAGRSWANGEGRNKHETVAVRYSGGNWRDYAKTETHVFPVLCWTNPS